MTNKFRLEIMSPDQVAFSRPVTLVAVPGVKGQYSVLPGHAPMVTEVLPGVVEIYEHDDHVVSERAFVTGGYCEVTTDRCSILADDVLPIDDFVRSDIQDEIKELMRQRAELPLDESVDDIEASLLVAKAKLQVMKR